MKVIIAIFILSSFIQGNTIFIFYPFLEQNDSLTNLFQNELPDTDLKIFGKYSKFKKSIENYMPEGIISTQIVIDELKPTYTNTLIGKKDTSTKETYSIISLNDNDIYLESVKSGTIGIVNQGDKTLNNGFVAMILKFRPNKTKRVTKTKDLLSLLRFNIIDYAIIKSTELKKIQDITMLKFYSKEIEYSEANIISFSQLHKDVKLTKDIKNLSQSINALMSIDTWIIK